MGYIRRHKRGFNCIKNILYIEPTREQKVIIDENRVIRNKELSVLKTKLGMIMAATSVLSGINNRY